MAKDTAVIQEYACKTESTLEMLKEKNEKDEPQSHPDESVDDRATAELVKHPDWTNIQIAEAIGCNPKTLSNKKQCPKFFAARKAYQSGNPPPRGHKTRDGNIEAYDEE